MNSNTRERAMSVYAAHFAAHGYRGTSLETVARQVGVRKPTLYHHFPGGKETLHHQVALAFIERRGHALNRALSTQGELATVLEAVITEAVADPTGADTSFDHHLFDSLDQLEEDLRAELRTAYVSTLLDPLTEHLRSAVNAGELADHDPALLCNAFLHLARAVDLSGTEPGARALVDLFLNGARPA